MFFIVMQFLFDLRTLHVLNLEVNPVQKPRPILIRVLIGLYRKVPSDDIKNIDQERNTVDYLTDIMNEKCLLFRLLKNAHRSSFEYFW